MKRLLLAKRGSKWMLTDDGVTLLDCGPDKGPAETKASNYCRGLSIEVMLQVRGLDDSRPLREVTFPAHTRTKG